MSAVIHPEQIIIGLMSGTSVDGIDAAAVKIQMKGYPLKLMTCELVGQASADWPEDIRKQLLAAMHQKGATFEDLGRLNQSVGQQFGDLAKALCASLSAQNMTVDAVASHGQTIYHQPPASGANGFTMQIGDPTVIATLCGVPVVADFRPGDMALGGQGAPLVPFADMLLFQDTQNTRLVQNIGGIANVTVVPPVTNPTLTPMAFDTGPGNMVIDALTQRLFHQPFDTNGDIAQRGKRVDSLYQDWMSDPYLTQAPPKSTGREVYGEAFTQRILERYAGNVPPEDLVHTASCITADTIVQAYERFILPKTSVDTVIIGGGGAKNTFLMARLEAALRPHQIKLSTHEAYGMDSQYKEALAFALLGYARLMNEPNNIPSCTGASRACSLGGVYLP